MVQKSGHPERTTISRVAAAAGVSRATVSRVMNGTGSVAPELVSRVRAAAEALHSEPSLVARSLALGRTGTISLVVPDLANPIADRYRETPAVAGYNPVNEPADPSGELIGPFYERLERAIRAVDSRHILFLDGNRYSTDFSMFGDPPPNTVYATHDYALPGIAVGSEYPGRTRGEYFDRSVVEQTFLRRTEHMRRTGTPIWIGEFGPVYTSDPERDRARYRLLRDQLDIYREHAASWSLWTYKDIGVQGLVYARPDSGYVRRIGPALEKKRRLGADSWGGDDRQVRHILDPLEELFDREFPEFDPFPWGRKAWLQRLVRNIVLAEPLVQDFGRCFEAVSPDEAVALARSFAFAQCARRAPLADLISDHLRPRSEMATTTEKDLPRYAIVGTGARAEIFVRALAVDHARRGRLVALADPNPVRLRAHNDALTALGAPAAALYPAAEFRRMLDRERVDVVVVTTIDREHDHYIVAALDAGCDVITEKPMTIDVARCRRILDAVARTGRRVTVTFNYRYNPLHEAVRRLLHTGEIGEIGSVHFEWLLDVRHGADYFRRWHRDKANSGGLLVHKATHHFDLVNWWLGTAPEQVYAQGRLFFYGDAAGARHGYAREYERAHGSAAATDDPFALDLAASPGLRRLYLDAESHDGYHRDRNVFASGVTIEDDLSVLVRYANGAAMTYHLTAYSPWEGYRVMFNGSKGRLELEVVENDHVAPAALGKVPGASLHGAEAAVEQGSARLRVCPFWRPPYDVEVPGHVRAGHGGADTRMTAALFAAGEPVDPLGRSASERDGALSLLTGLAANESLATGGPVNVRDLLDIDIR